MMIQIRYHDGRFDMIKTSQLDRLLRSGQISAFRRQDGWVEPGRAPLRGDAKQTFYLGAERRSPQGPGTLSQ